jgi:hypothetical protein
MLQREAFYWNFIPVDGFSDLSSQLAVGADSVVLTVCMRGGPFWGAFVDVELVFQLS